MNKKLQEMWDAAHVIPQGAYVPEGTLLVRLDMENRLYHYEVPVSSYWRTVSNSAPVRSVEPLPDPDDTGLLTVHYGEGFLVLVDTYDDRCYNLTENQALNLVRMIKETIDGH